MYRTNDPRFRRRLNEIGQTLESANESAQSNIYIFGQTYVKPCFESVAACMATCIDASCPSLNLNQSQRDRMRRQRGRARSQGRAELSFDFYDDWDEDENDGLLGWGNDEFDRLVAGSGGYGTVTHNTQPARQRGMSYPKGRRKSAALPHNGSQDPTVIPGSSLFGKLFGGKARRYKPSAADLQEHPGARRLGRDITEGEALLEETRTGASRKKHKRTRSGTVASATTTDSYSSRGDIFPSDEEDDAVPLDDEFAMVLERRTTQSGGGGTSGPETESSSGRSKSDKRSKRPSAGSRASTRRTLSTRSTHSLRRSRSQRGSSGAQTPVEEVTSVVEDEVPTLLELKHEEHEVEREEEADIDQRRQEAQKLAAERGLVSAGGEEDFSSKEATPRSSTPVAIPPTSPDEPSQLPTPSATDDENEPVKTSAPASVSGAEESSP